MRLYGRSLCLELHVPSPGVTPLFCTLFRPSPPASALTGLMCGAVAVDPGGQPPYATRVVMVRVRAAAAELETSNRYLEPAESFSEDLGHLGLPPPHRAELDQRILAVLQGRGASGGDQVPAADYAALAMVCDRLWLK